MASIGLEQDGTDGMGSSSQMQKQLLAQEVVKLRREVATLRAAGSAPVPASSAEEETEIRRLRSETQDLESQKAAIIAQANAQKALLAKEVKTLRTELDRIRSGSQAHEVQPASALSTQQTKEIGAQLERRVEFEENFTRTIRDLRRELEQSDLKALQKNNQMPLSVRALIQLSNERVERTMEEAAQVPVEERVHIETLRLLMENAKLRKILNDYSEGILHNTLSRIDGNPKSKSATFFGIL